MGIRSVRSLSSFYGLPLTMDFSGFGDRAKYLWTGGNINGGHYDWHGNFMEPTPITGIAPAPDFAKGANLLLSAKNVQKFVYISIEIST